jgi:hypothetical protein
LTFRITLNNFSTTTLFIMRNLFLFVSLLSALFAHPCLSQAQTAFYNNTITPSNNHADFSRFEYLATRIKHAETFPSTTSIMFRQRDADVFAGQPAPFFKEKKKRNHLKGAGIGFVCGFLISAGITFLALPPSSCSDKNFICIDRGSTSLSIGFLGGLTGAIIGAVAGVPIDAAPVNTSPTR